MDKRILLSSSELGELLLGEAVLPGALPAAGISHHITLDDKTYKYGFMIVPGSSMQQRINEVAPTSSGVQSPTYAEGAWKAWVQEDFSGGMGQEYWKDNTKLLRSEEGVWPLLPGRLSLGPIRKTGIFIHSGNNKLDFTEDGGELNVSVTVNTWYTPSLLGTALKAAMEAAGTNTYTVSYSGVTGLFTFTRSAGAKTFTILWDSGVNAAETVGVPMGYDTTGDDTPSPGPYVGDYVASCPVDVGRIVRGFIDYGDDCYGLGSQGVRIYDPSYDGWKDSKPAIGAACIGAAVYGADLFVLIGKDDEAWWLNGTTWTECTGAMQGDYCLTYKDNKLYYSAVNEVFSTDAPKTSAGTVAFTVGSAAWDITSLCIYNGELYIGKPEGLYRWDGTTVIQVLDTTPQLNISNFHGMIEWQGFLYFGILNRLYKMSISEGSATMVDVTPQPTSLDGESHRRKGYGMPAEFVPVGNTLFVGFNGGGPNADRVYIMAYNGVGWAIVAERRTSDAPSYTAVLYGMGYSPVSDVLWISTSDVEPIPVNIASDMPYPWYSNSGVFYSSVHRGAFPREPKSYHKIWFHTRDCSATEKISVEVRSLVDGDLWDIWSGNKAINTVGTITKSPYQELIFKAPGDSDAEAMEAQAIYLKLGLERSTSGGLADIDKTPIIERFGVMFQDRIRPIDAFSVQVLIGPAEHRDTGERLGRELMEGFGLDTVEPEEAMAFLEYLERNVKGIDYVDQDGYLHRVLINSVMKENPIINEQGYNEFPVRLQMIEVG